MSAKEHLRHWLARGMTGCQFAAKIASQRSRVVSVSFPGLADPDDVTAVFEGGRAAKLPTIALFPGIRTEEQLAQQLAGLQSDRWRIAEVTAAGARTEDVFVGVDWRIRDGLVSSVMGFAPFASMPVTRRAPYVCMAAWPGDHDNEHWTKYEDGVVHFLDTDLTDLALSKAKYQSMTKGSVAATKDLLSEPPDDARFYRRAAFRLSPSTRALLRPVFARRP